MEKIYQVLILVLISAVLSFGQSKFQAGETDKNRQRKIPAEKLIAEKENARWEALKNKRFGEFAKQLAENYRGVYRDGFFNKADELEVIQQLGIESYSLSEMKIIFPAREIAVVTYTVEMQSRIGGQPVSVEANVTSVWLSRNGRWVAVSHTEAEINDR